MKILQHNETPGHRIEVDTAWAPICALASGSSSLKVPSLGGGERLRSLHRSDGGRAATAVAKRRGGLVSLFKTPLILSKGDGIFINRGAAERHEKLLKKNPLLGRSDGSGMPGLPFQPNHKLCSACGKIAPRNSAAVTFNDALRNRKSQASATSFS